MTKGYRRGGRYEREIVFSFSDCGPGGDAGLYPVMKLFGDIGGDDYGDRDLGYKKLMELGQAFLLSRCALKICRLPMMDEKVKISTWEQKISGVFFFRDYELLDEAGNIIISSVSNWILVDPATREVLRPDAFAGEKPADSDQAADCPQCPRLRMPADVKTVGERPVYYSDLDANGHVNNAVYSRIATDFLPVEYRGKCPGEYYIIFKKETLPGEILTISTSSVGSECFVQGTVDGEQRFIAKFVF